MTHRVGTKGQVVIPKAIRDEIGIEPGDEVVFASDGSDVRVRRASDDQVARDGEIEALFGQWAGFEVGTAELAAERHRERVVEERKAQRWGVDSSR